MYVHRAAGPSSCRLRSWLVNVPAPARLGSWLVDTLTPAQLRSWLVNAPAPVQLGSIGKYPGSSPIRVLIGKCPDSRPTQVLIGECPGSSLTQVLIGECYFAVYFSGHYSRQNPPSITIPNSAQPTYQSQLNTVIMVYYLLIWLIISLVCLPSYVKQISTNISIPKEIYIFSTKTYPWDVFSHLLNATFIPPKLLIHQYRNTFTYF